MTNAHLQVVAVQVQQVQLHQAPQQAMEVRVLHLQY
jgi:hypothetical protein